MLVVNSKKNEIIHFFKISCFTWVMKLLCICPSQLLHDLVKHYTRLSIKLAIVCHETFTCVSHCKRI